ncbi:MAG TPA: alcohol dehydrogenase catalytic domain-containing protein [Anaerolineales bacterium]|nr:alcohol dehydrogenase catalytic domain-containing protein [Anaerolineales bacterium]
MKGTMKAIQKARPEPGIDLVEVPIPTIQPDEVLVRVEATALCGSDIHFYHWDDFAQRRIQLPVILGHEFCGEVVEVGSAVEDYRVGDYVTADSHIVCGKCDVCRIGLQHICQNLKIFGNDVAGSFAQYVPVPETSLWPLTRDVPSEVGAILEPLGGATQAVLIEPVTAQSVVIFGDGPIALFGAGVAAASGAKKVYLVGMVPSRLEIARKMGAHMTFNINDPVDPVQAILDDTRGIGADVVVEMAGAPQAVQNAFAVVRKGGRVTTFGLTPKPIEFDLNFAVTLRQVTVRGVAGRHMWDTWKLVDGLLASGRLDPRPVITHRIPLEECDRGFQLMTTGSRDTGKIVMFPNGMPA